MENTQQQYEPERSGSSRQDAKVAIPRLQNMNYQMSATTRPQRPRNDVVSKAVSAASPTATYWTDADTRSSVRNAASEVGLSQLSTLQLLLGHD